MGEYSKASKTGVCLGLACALTAFIPALQLAGLVLGMELKMTALGVPWLAMSALAWGCMAYGASARAWDLRGRRGRAAHAMLPLLVWDGLWLGYRVHPLVGMTSLAALMPLALRACREGSDDRQARGRKAFRRIMGAFACLAFCLIVPALLLWDFGVTETVAAYPSPYDRRVAEVWNVDEGALGGSTLVMVSTPGRRLPLLLGTLEDRPHQVYRGIWGEHLILRVEWLDEESLSINGLPCVISGFTDRKNGKTR